MENNCYEKYLTNSFAKEKYADLILKIVEKIYGILFASLLSVPAIYLIFPATNLSVPFWVILGLTVTGIVVAIYLTILALKQYQALGDVHASKSAEMPDEVTHEQLKIGNEINISSSENVSISINCSTTKISIHIEPTPKEIQ